MNDTDPLDILFLSKEESARLKEEHLRRQLADYLTKMPKELKTLFYQEFERKQTIKTTPVSTVHQR